MKPYYVKLESEVFKTFRCQMAANSLDIDVGKKSTHELNVTADLDGDFSVAVILGASGSGKTTLAQKMFGEDFSQVKLDLDRAIIDQFPETYSYDECAALLSGIGLTSVPCWIRPVKTLSNGQRARAEASLAMTIATEGGLVVIDEWTSVVDRTVAKVMSHCVQKFARRFKKKLVLLSCHYDVVEWLDPDWVVDCNTQKFTDRRLLQPDARQRTEQLTFDVRLTTAATWKYFSKYHYLSGVRVGGRVHHFGLFHGENQVGYACLANYVPWTNKKKPMIVHASRIVIHPDYAGFGLGIRFTNAIVSYGRKTWHYRVLCKMSSVPLCRLMQKDKQWRCMKVNRQIGLTKFGKQEKTDTFKVDGRASFRTNVKTWTFEYLGK